MDQRQHSFCVFFCSLHQVSTVCTFYKSFIIYSAGVGLGLCFGLLTYLVVISAMAKPQEILIPSYKDPERQAQYASK